MINQNYIRNFCIISHIDHGKSTLADRFLELTGTVEKRKMREQFLDQMDLERERGITIKLQPVRMEYTINSKSEYRDSRQIQNSNDQNSKIVSNFRFPALDLSSSKYILNLIDTPGHVDFSYEVSRSLAAVEGAILLVDAVKGIQAQTLSNLHLALEQNLVIIPVINKIDLPNARVEEVEKEIWQVLESRICANNSGDRPAASKPGLDICEIIKISAKYGTNVEQVLKAVIEKIPPPSGKENEPLRALIFDSIYDSYKGVIAYVRIIDGQIKRGDKILIIASGKEVEALEVGFFKPQLTATEKLKAGDIGYIATGLKDVSLCRVGDTISTYGSKVQPLPGYKEPQPMVFASFYPVKGGDFDLLKEALGKLKLNDASLIYESESSSALGRGFKCGFLGMLHLEIVSERLKREYGLDLVITTPSVVYKCNSKFIYSPAEWPEPNLIRESSEPWVKLEIMLPNNYLGPVMKLLQDLGGQCQEITYLSQENLLITYEAPLREIIIDFYDKLKSVSSGYASMNYSFLDYRPVDLVRLDILVAGEKVEAFSRIVPKKDAYSEARALLQRLKELIPQQLFAVALQAVLGLPRSGGQGGKIIARETIKARRKDVIGYLYGGDYTRKRKLLEKQKRGKKKMKAFGKVKIPQEVFLKVLKRQ